VAFGGLALVLALGGCVSYEERVFTKEASPEETLELRVELARKYIGQGDWENAKRNLKLAFEIDPRNPAVHEAFALVYQSTGEYELAEEHFKTAIKLDKTFSRARNNYAAFLYSQERYEEAAKQLEVVTRDSLYRGRPNAFVNLGMCRLQLFDKEGAEAAFMRALTMDRTNTIALLEVAQLRLDAGDYEAAQQFYDTYRSVARQQSSRALWLGIRLARARGDRDAEGSYVLALTNLYPESAEYEAYLRTIKSD
jgi:type IV pilus assembly protein PilF